MIDLSMLPQGAITAVLQVIMIDLVLAGDNAVVIGLAAAGLPPAQRSKAILVGIIAATVLRLAFAAIAIELLAVVGLLLAGGILLLWVCWKMWRELRPSGTNHNAANGSLSGDYSLTGCRRGARAPARADLRAHPFRRADGDRSIVHRATPEPFSMDRLCRARDYPL